MLSAMNYYEKEENIYHYSSIAPFETRDVLAASHMFTLCTVFSHTGQIILLCSVQIFANFEDRKQIYCPGFVSFFVTTQNL